MIKTIACLILILSAQFAFAWPPTYGAEFELLNSDMRFNSYNFESNPSGSPEKKSQMVLVEFLRKKCATAGCEILEVSGKYDSDYQVKFKDGFWIQYSYDPSCVEVTFKPLTLEELKKNAARINEYVFEAGKSVKMYTVENNTTHFNAGIKSLFKNSAEEFLRFYVDYANHPDLALGSLGLDLSNAPPLSVLKDSQREALKKIVIDFNNGLIPSIQVAAKRIETEVYTHSYEKDWGGKNHYQAVGLKYVNKTDLNEKDAPMELRSVWAQHSTEDFIKIAELVEARVAYLNKNKGPIVYNQTKKMKFTKGQIKTRFRMYIEEAGLEFKNYETLLPEDMRKTRQTPISNPEAPVEKRLLDLINYFDLLSSSENTRKAFIEVLSDLKIQDDPRTKAYQQYFEKMSKKDPKATIIKTDVSWFTKILTFLGLTKPEVVEHINEQNTKELFKNLHEAIESKKRENAKWTVIDSYKTSDKKKPLVFSCESLF